MSNFRGVMKKFVKKIFYFYFFKKNYGVVFFCELFVK